MPWTPTHSAAGVQHEGSNFHIQYVASKFSLQRWTTMYGKTPEWDSLPYRG